MGRPRSELNLLERLVSKIVIDNVTDCWVWQGGKNNIGYGMIRDGKQMRTTHRVSYEEHSQTKIPAGLCVLHRCDYPLCCNPQHLWLGTLKDNTQDMLRKGRATPFGGIGMRGKKQPKTICTHCSKPIPNNLFSRWHGDNCKSKL